MSDVFIFYSRRNSEFARRLIDRLVLAGHTNSMSTLAFSPDGTRIYTASWDSSINVWRNDTVEALQQWAQANRYVPELSCTQRASYGLITGPVCSD
mgnify:CR=1 FL=1